MPPPSENAGPYLRAAILIYSTTRARSGNAGRWRWEERTANQLATIVPEDLEAIIERNRDALELLPEGSDHASLRPG